jgi:hypothetical protein
MGTGFLGHHCTLWCPLPSPRHGSKEAVVARRDHNPSRTLQVRITFEPSRVSPACVVQAYERVVPITRRPALRARWARQAVDAQPMQHVGGRQHP